MTDDSWTDRQPTLRIEIFPSDLDRALEFYTRLGFTIVRCHDASPVPYAELRYGHVRLGLAERDAVDPALHMLPTPLARPSFQALRVGTASSSEKLTDRAVIDVGSITTRQCAPRSSQLGRTLSNAPPIVPHPT